MKKPVIVFTTADKNNFPYAVMLLNSLRKFHDWPVVLVTDEKDEAKLKLLPKGVEVVDLEPFLKVDPAFFYRQKATIAEKFIKEYDLVLGLDADQIICGDLGYILDTKDYDVAGVLNYNSQDAELYGVIQGWGINPIEYWNCGLVAMRSEKFVHEWLVWCHSNQFDRVQYKEQDGLNIKVYHGNWNCRVLDHGDKIAGMTAWWGLIAKTSFLSCVMKGNDIIIPKGVGEVPFPAEDTVLKVIHMAEGNKPNKMNYKTMFQEPVIARLDKLVSNQ